MNLWKVEEDQFQQYAQKVINEAKDRGAPTYPLQVTAKTGAGMYMYYDRITIYH